MDVLADVLSLARVHGTLGARIEAGARWGWWATGIRGAAFHAVTSGTAWLAPRGQAPRQLLPGDVVLLPHGTEHAIGADEATVAATGPDNSSGYERAGGAVVRIGSGDTRTHILCAHYEHDPAISLFAPLPDVIHIQGAYELDDTVRLLGRELASPGLATGVVLDRLVDILLVQLLRAWLATAPVAVPSWLGALRDPVVGDAVSLLHAAPDRDWTNAALARELAVSPATLGRRFATALGETPAAYLTRWRMDLAARRLRDTDDPLAAVARSVGYTSVYAFSRAFSRTRGLPPGRYRAAA
ncbi:AraC family transcriptional regulator [Solirubrobacter soli]|uniref:AraC family transcriptional regulator n=1 Tax=Solirubrobacter soli TaxID=363832 RepID=UPI0003F7C42F|nr:AraC family transcriptional regulator [Solirubrobacter soli]